MESTVQPAVLPRHDTRPLRGAATAEGIAVYDLKQRAMQSLLLVFSGTHGRPNDEAVCAAGAVVEWHHQRSAR